MLSDRGYLTIACVPCDLQKDGGKEFFVPTFADRIAGLSGKTSAHPIGGFVDGLIARPDLFGRNAQLQVVIDDLDAARNGILPSSYDKSQTHVIASEHAEQWKQKYSAVLLERCGLILNVTTLRDTLEENDWGIGLEEYEALVQGNSQIFLTSLTGEMNGIRKRMQDQIRLRRIYYTEHQGYRNQVLKRDPMKQKLKTSAALNLANYAAQGQLIAGNGLTYLPIWDHEVGTMQLLGADFNSMLTQIPQRW